MMHSSAATFWLGLLALENTATATFLGVNMSLHRCANNPKSTSYGKDACRCVGIDNLKGYYATQEDFYHVQRSAETGASCATWDMSMHPKCRGSYHSVPEWCKQQWCYVDPCSCDLDVLPKASKAGIKYQGSTAYWSYDTCGGMDFYSQEMSPDACIMQKSKGDCSKNSKCAWDGKQCGGKEVLETCKSAVKKDESIYGQEDCRCIGLDGRDTGKAFMFINSTHQVSYPANVGATCQAWEMQSHPDCKKDGDKPAWCSAKWCAVDPCKCKTKIPPLTVMPANQVMRFQGKTLYWSYDTCGSKDTWSSSHGGEYCLTQKSETECSKLSKCAWNGKNCLGKALVEICAKQEESGVLGVEAPLLSNSINSKLAKTLTVFLAAFVTAQIQ